MAIVGYARCSTVEQSLDTQIERLKAAGADQIFSEKKSASNADRLELVSAIRSLREGDIFLVTKLDRFARNVMDLCRLVKEIEEKGASFRCLDQQVDTSGAAGRAMLHMMAVFAEFELDLRAERQKEGIAKAKEKGVYASSRHEIAPGKLAWASRYLKSGMSYAQVSEKMGISVDTLQRKFPGYKNPVAVAREAAKKAKSAPEFAGMKIVEDRTVPPGGFRLVGADGQVMAQSQAVNVPTVEAITAAYAVDPDGVAYSGVARYEPAPKRRGLFGMLRR